MRLELRSLHSPDLERALEEGTVDMSDFDILVFVGLAESGEPDEVLFYLRVCSASALADTESGRFLSHTLVLDRFDWQAIRTRIEKLLRHTTPCSDWNAVIANLAPNLRYAN